MPRVKFAVIIAMAFLAVGAGTASAADPAHGANQGAIALQPGTRIRVHSQQLSYLPIVGSFIAARADTMEFQGRAQDTGERRFITSLGTIQKLEVSRGKKGNGRLGMLIGALAFAGIAAITTPDKSDPTAIGFHNERLGAVVIGGIGGLVWGGVIGRSIKTERWKAVPLQ